MTWLGACSQLPIEPLTGHRDHDVVAEFDVPADGRVTLPASDASRRIDHIAWTPAPLAESFVAGARSFVFAPGARVQARLRFRTFAAGGGEAATAAAALPNAVAVRAADAP